MFLLFGKIKDLFFGNTLSFVWIGLLVAILGMVILPNLNQISEKLGLETRTTLKVDLAKQKQNVDIAVAANIVLAKDIKKVEAIGVLNTDTVVIHAENTDKITKVTKVRLNKKKVAITNIPKTSDIVLEQSKIQITSIWEQYCDTTSTTCDSET